MIKRLYIDNFRCMVNFEYRPGRMELLLGENGTGKSTVFEVLQQIQTVVVHGAPAEGFNWRRGDALTAWDTRSDQRFELDIEGNSGIYVYTLTVERDQSGERSRITDERLTYNDHDLYYFDGGDAHLFRDDFSWPAPSATKRTITT